MPRRYYSSTAVATTLSASANNSTTSITVTALSGYPTQFPYTAIIDPDTASEEVVTVTAASGTTLTVTRGSDGTTAVSHNAGAVFRHGVSARDFDEANAFANGGGVSNSLVNAKGDLVTATANDTPAILTAGSNGQVLMADSSATAGLRYVDPPANRNILINSDVKVAQRGTSSTGNTSVDGCLTADRWDTRIASLGTWTQTVESDAPTGSGFRSSLKMLCTAASASPASNGILGIRHKIEGQDLQRVAKGTADARQLTLSFWVKSNVTGTFVCQLSDADNSRQVGAQYSISQSATWERKVITFPADSTGAFDNDNGLSMLVVWWLAAGSDRTSGTLRTSWTSSTNADHAVGQTNLAAATNNYWQITGVQLETGPVATPFEFEPYEATLRKCQRYYYLHASGSAQAICNFAYYTSTYILGVVQFPTTMRTGPSVVVTSGTDFYSIDRNGGNDGYNNLSVEQAGTNAARLGNATEVSGTAGHGGTGYTNNASASIAFSAEL